MQKPVCLKCACYFRPHRNGVYYVEMKPKAGHNPARGRKEPEGWEPYKVWQADLWQCPECKSLMICGSGRNPVTVSHMDNFSKWVSDPSVILLVNDC